jgi:HAMP domain-containing protein
MRNMSIRTRILAGVLIVNVLGAVAIVVYLHQSYSRSIDDTAAITATQGLAAWEQIKGPETQIDPLASPEEAAALLERMKAVTGVDYGLLVDKNLTDAESYAAVRESVGLASNWDERDVYALLATTDEGVSERMQFAVTPESVPEAGKAVGIENGACSATCHNSVTGEGEYWTVRWSTDSVSRAHAVFPVVAADGAPIGAIYAVEDISAQADDARASMVRTLMVIVITLVVMTLVIAGLVDRLVLRRLNRTSVAIQDLFVRVAGGDFDAHFEPDGTTDEIGSLEQFFSEFMDLVSSTLKSLSEIKKKAA